MAIPAIDFTQRQLLAEALQLSRWLTQGKLAADQVQTYQARLCQIREALKSFVHPLQRDRLSAQAIPLEIRQTFVRAVLLVTRYRQVGADRWQGSLASPTLEQYQTDPIPAQLLRSEAIARLSQIFALPPEAETELAAALAATDRRIANQTRILTAVLKFLRQGEADEARLSLFHNLFGPIPIPGQAIDYLYTPMQLYFCLDYRDGKLNPPELWQELTPQAQTEVQGFLQSLNQFSFEQFHRFPIFGPCDPRHLNLAWCEQIAAQAAVPTSEVITVLSRSVSIIATQKAEAFLLHDIWGHHWQAMLTEFESDYETLRYCGESLRAAETAYTTEGPLSCREIFEQDGLQVWVNGDRARAFFRAEAQQRLGLMFTHLIGELLADVAEFKFIWTAPRCADQLLSSSLFKSQPTKLDLSLADLDFLFLRVLRSLLEVQISVFESSDLERDLLAEWRTTGARVDSLELQTNLKQAIAHLYQIFLEEYNTGYLPTMAGETGIFAQIASNLLHLQNAIDSLYTDGIANQSLLPFQDLLLVFIGAYCARDSYNEFWAIDDILAAYFLPCWLLLASLEPAAKS